jgi:hypothetical protein
MNYLPLYVLVFSVQLEFFAFQYKSSKQKILIEVKFAAVSSGVKYLVKIVE